MNWFAEIQFGDAVVPVYPGARLWHPLSGSARELAFRALNQQCHGPHGWLPAQGGLIANLRVWENCLLPAAFFTSRSLAQEELRFGAFLDALKIAPADRKLLSRATVAMLSPVQRRQALMLRTLMTAPRMILIESEWLQQADEQEAECYAAALQAHCPQAAWVVLGPQRPDALWRISLEKESGHVPAA